MLTPGISPLTADPSTYLSPLVPAVPVVVVPPRTEVLATPSPPPPLPPLVRNCVTIWDVPFDRVSMWDAIERVEELVQRREPSYVITANLNYCMLHQRMESLHTVTQNASLIVADGQPIVWRSLLSETPLPERVAGAEMIERLCGRAAQRGWRVYMLGGAEGVAHAAAAKLLRMHPGLQIVGIESPPFRSLTQQEQRGQESRIRQAHPDLLLVAFGQPKGELWIAERYQRLGVPVSIQLGASFDFLAGTASRAPELLQRFGLEWVHRMVSDPRRLVPRYAANASYLASSLWNDWKRQVTAWGLGEWAGSAKR